MSEENNMSNANGAAEQPPAEQANKSQPFLWLIVAGIGIYLAVQSLGFSVVLNIFIVAMGIGVVVGVHEFGHFSIAKLTGMKVEAFSLGFPPALVSFKRAEKGYRIRFLPTLIRKSEAAAPEGAKAEEGGIEFYFGGPKKEGETEYKIGLMPFGGFVKILGQEDVGAVKSTGDPRAYSNKPAWARALVLVAGVSFNLIAAILISIAVFRIGIKFIPPVAGDVVPWSPAAMAGIESGDEIIEIAGRSFNLDLTEIAMESGFSEKGQIIPVKVRSEDGTIRELELISEDGDLQRKLLLPFGIDGPKNLSISKLATEDEEKELYEITGLKPGDVICAVNGQPVGTYGELTRMIKDIFEPEVTVTIERKDGKGEGADANTILFDTKIPLALSSPLKRDAVKNDIGEVYSILPRLKVIGVSELLSTDDWRAGDIIVKVDGIAEPNFKQLRETTEMNDGKQFPIEVLRADANGVEQIVTVNAEPRYDPDRKRVTIGIILSLDLSRPVAAQTIPFGEREEGLGIPGGAEILSVNGQKVSNFYDIAKIVSENYGQDVKFGWIKEAGEEEKIIWMVNGQKAYKFNEFLRLVNEYFDNEIRIKCEANEGENGIAVITEEDWKNFGTARSVISQEIPFELMSRLYKAESPLQAVKMGYGKTISFVEQQYLTLKALAQRKLSPKGLMGPVGIVRASYKLVKEKQFVDYAYIIGVMINAAVAVINLLPILPLDGGALFFLLIEKLKGSPVSEKFQTSLATAGVVLVILVSIYITVNDIMR